MDPENNKKLEQYKNGSKRESEGAPSRPEMRSHADFEAFVTKGNENALRKTNGDYLSNEEVKKYVREFFESHLGVSDEKADAFARKVHEKLKKLAPLITEKRELKKQEQSDEQRRRIQEIDKKAEAVRKRVIETLAHSIEEVTHGDPKQNAEQQKTSEERTESTEVKKAEDTNTDVQQDAETAPRTDPAERTDGTHDVINAPRDSKAVSKEQFLELLLGDEGVTHLRERLDQRTKEIDRLCRRKGIKKTDIPQLIRAGELSVAVSWQEYQQNKRSISDYFKRVDEMGTALDPHVASSYHALWVKWFADSDALWDALETYTPSAEVSSDEKDESSGEKHVESTKFETQTHKEAGDPDQKSDEKTKVTAGSKEPSKQQEEHEHSEVDPEFRKEVEDTLEAIDTEIVETFPHPEALPRSEKYQQLQERIREVRADLNEEDPDEEYGMYGHRSYKDKIDEKIETIRELKSELFADFDGEAETEAAASQEAEPDQIEKGKRMVEVSAGEDAPVSYEAARAEWKAARKEWERVKDEYESALSEHYQKSYGNALQRGVYHISSVFGGSPSFPEHVREMENQYTKARRDYMQSIKSVLAARTESQGEGHADNFEFEAEGIRSAVGKRFVLDAVRRRKEIRDSAFHPDDSEAKVRAQLRQAGRYLKEHKWSRRVGQLAMVGLVSGLTGGVAGALVATSHRAAGMVGGAAGGAVAGTAVWSLMGRSVRGHEETLSKSEEQVKTDVDVDSFRELEKQVMEQDATLEKSKKRQKAATVGAAAGAGLLVGKGFSDALDAADGIGGDAAGTADKESVSRERAAETSAPVTEQQPKTVSPPSPEPTPEPNITFEQSAAEAEQSTEAVPPPAEATTDATEADETQEVVDADIYEVQKGDNLWNILEGDVEGREMSAVLARIPEAHRDEALDALFDRVDSDESLREAIGMDSDRADVIKYDIDGKGNGEQLNISALERALEEVATEKGFISGEPVPQEIDTSRYERPGPDDGLRGTPDTSGYERPGPDDGLRGSDSLESGAPESEITTEQQDQVPTSETPQTLQERIPQERIVEVKDTYIKEHLKEQGGFLGTLLSSDTPNAYEILQNTQMEDIAEMDSVPEGMTESQWAKLVEMLRETSETTVPDRPDETLSEYMDRFARDHELARLQNAANDDVAASATRKAA